MKIISDPKDTLRTTSTVTAPGRAADAPGGHPPPVREYGDAFDPADGGRVRSRRAFVFVAIACAVLLVLASLGSIYRRWYNLRLPTSYIQLVGDESTADAEVTVLLDRKEVARVQLVEAEKFEKPVLVEPGLYTVEARVDGHLVVVHKFFLPDNARGIRLPITLRPEADVEAGLPPGTRAFQAGTRPASRPGG